MGIWPYGKRHGKWMMLNGKWPIIMVKWIIMDQHIHGWWCWLCSSMFHLRSHIHGKWPINDSQMANHAGERGDWRYNRFSHQTEDFSEATIRKKNAVFQQSLLVSGWALPLWKIMVWKSVGMMTFHAIPNWMESHQKFHENPNGSSHHQSDQSVYAEQHPNSQDNQKSLLLLSQWIIGSQNSAPKCPSAAGR